LQFTGTDLEGMEPAYPQIWVIGKMRNAESKMWNRKLWKWLWNGG